MQKALLPLLADPVTHAPLKLENAKTDKSGNIISGMLVASDEKSRRYPIVNGIPRFVPQTPLAKSVHSFGEQWNYFNFDKFHANWRAHIIEASFGSLTFLKNKTIVEAGAGSGMHTRWLAQSGAKHVIALELSHSVDGIMKQNLKGLKNVDIIQCSIDAIPLKSNAIPNLVMCVNVIQHTPSVQRTAAELWRITGKGAELAFNCYSRTDETLAHRAKHKLYTAVRAVVSRLPFWGRWAYAHFMSAFRMLPLVGALVEKLDLMRRGSIVHTGPGYYRHLYRAGVINTFDYFGAHRYQHHHSNAEIQTLARNLQPDTKKHGNTKGYYAKPQPAGLLLRLKK